MICQGWRWFWIPVVRCQVLSERDRGIVIGADENGRVGMCFMAVSDEEPWE